LQATGKATIFRGMHPYSQANATLLSASLLLAGLLLRVRAR
jgi:hypothetical protein